MSASLERALALPQPQESQELPGGLLCSPAAGLSPGHRVSTSQVVPCDSSGLLLYFWVKPCSPRGGLFVLTSLPPQRKPGRMENKEGARKQQRRTVIKNLFFKSVAAKCFDQIECHYDL